MNVVNNNCTKNSIPLGIIGSKFKIYFFWFFRFPLQIKNNKMAQSGSTIYIITSAGFDKSIGFSLGFGTSVGFWACSIVPQKNRPAKRVFLSVIEIFF
ncbi:MAG: hypothetical protein CL528_04915 [Aequorivita sp.]|nr:hypothetical protein [Aequorivita sp.]MBP41093.1 hypothetical protein [Aequorivita sp.]HBC04180.1 hypothetical protein [Aequorivita sp.]